jgi:hypothetical protein
VFADLGESGALRQRHVRALWARLFDVDRAPYDKWRSLSFPVGSSVDEVDEAHADLAYWDAVTVGAVIPLADGSGTYDPGGLDFRAGLVQFRERLVGLQATSSAPESDTLNRYIEYVDALVAVHSWASGER